MTDEMFPDSPRVTKKRAKKPTADTIAKKDMPIFECRVGLTRYYVKAWDDDSARTKFRIQYGRHGITDDEINVRRLLHADLVELVRIDPKLAGKLARL